LETVEQKYDCRRDILLVVVGERKIELQLTEKSLLDLGDQPNSKLKAKRLRGS
jgi:hypothetical protein